MPPAFPEHSGGTLHLIEGRGQVVQLHQAEPNQIGRLRSDSFVAEILVHRLAEQLDGPMELLLGIGLLISVSSVPLRPEGEGGRAGRRLLQGLTFT